MGTGSSRLNRSSRAAISSAVIPGCKYGPMVVPPSRVIEKTRMLTTRITKGRASNRRAMYLCRCSSLPSASVCGCSS